MALAISSASHSDSAQALPMPSGRFVTWPPRCHSSRGGPWRVHSRRAPQAATSKLTPLLDPNSLRAPLLQPNGRDHKHGNRRSCTSTLDIMSGLHTCAAGRLPSAERVKTRIPMRNDGTRRPTCQHGRLSHDLHFHAGSLQLSPRLYCVISDEGLHQLLQSLRRLHDPVPPIA